MNKLFLFFLFFLFTQNIIAQENNNGLIGADFSINDDGIEIIDIVPYGPAYSAGLKIGDIISIIDDLNIANLNDESEIINLIKGKPNTSVNFKV